MATTFGRDVTTHSGPPRREWPEPGVHTGYRDELGRAERACCCSASPAVIAVLPPTPGRAHHTGLTLCAHHYRAGREGQAAAGATVYDKDGKPVLPRSAALTGTR
jgi:hypothetical protein